MKFNRRVRAEGNSRHRNSVRQKYFSTRTDENSKRLVAKYGETSDIS